MPKPFATIDFETDKIQRRPVYPPKPVGVAIKEGGKKAKYFSWGHPCENNSTMSDVKRILKRMFREYNCIFHNSAFDIAVAMEYMGCPFPSEFEDTYFLSYLYDPRDDSLELKAWADKYLDMPPEEQDLLKEWILENIPAAKSKPSIWGEFISLAPGKLVGRYAVGDVDRTWEMFKVTYEYAKETGMLKAYEREKKVLPIFESMSGTGIKVDVPRLKRDVKKWQKDHKELERDIKKRLGVKNVGRMAERNVAAENDFDVTSGRQLADALDRTGKVDEWVYTKPSRTFPHGQRSTKRDVLLEVCTDTKLVHMLARYGILSTYMNTFMNPWLETAEVADGYIYPTYNQVRSVNEKGKSTGTRTGRPSSSHPNLFNVPKDPEDKDMPWTIGLPKMRNYLIPDEGGIFLNRDYSQQEVRILAHFEDAGLLLQYQQNPTLDVHSLAQELIRIKTGVLYPRKFIKICGFGIIYGMGAYGLSIKLKISKDDAAKLKSDYLAAIPGIKNLNKSLRRCAADDVPISTWGGRQYYVEEPKLIDGRKRSFEYKLLNYLVQGSAADCTKEAMIRVDDVCDSRMVLQVYDELMLCSEKGSEKKEMQKMKDAMESIEFDVAMLSDGKMGAKSWGEAKNYKDPKVPW